MSEMKERGTTVRNLCVVCVDWTKKIFFFEIQTKVGLEWKKSKSNEKEKGATEKGGPQSNDQQHSEYRWSYDGRRGGTTLKIATIVYGTGAGKGAAHCTERNVQQWTVAR